MWMGAFSASWGIPANIKRGEAGVNKQETNVEWYLRAWFRGKFI